MKHAFNTKFEIFTLQNCTQYFIKLQHFFFKLC
jgi:hypothetical protein